MLRAVVALALRFVPLLAEEAQRIAPAPGAARRPAARGLRRASGAHARARWCPTLVATLERADQVALALEARHYRLRPTARAPLARGRRVARRASRLSAVALVWRG